MNPWTVNWRMTTVQETRKITTQLGTSMDGQLSSFPNHLITFTETLSCCLENSVVPKLKQIAAGRLSGPRNWQ